MPIVARRSIVRSGRARDPAQARALLRRPDRRLLTLTGAGGARLGLALSREFCHEPAHVLLREADAHGKLGYAGALSAQTLEEERMGGVDVGIARHRRRG